MFDIEKAIVKNIKNAAFLEHTSGSAATTPQRQCYGISFCVDGLIVFEHDGKKIELTPNSAIFCPKKANTHGNA